MPRKPIDFKRIKAFILSALIAFLISYSLPNEAIKNSDLSNVLITIFSVFAGFMIALMALTSHIHETKSWKEIAVTREAIEARLFRQQLLFYGYLSTLVLIVASIIIEHYDLWGYSEEISEFIRRLYLFIGMLSLLLSFSLPGSLKKLHQQAITEQMNETKRQKTTK